VDAAIVVPVPAASLVPVAMAMAVPGPVAVSVVAIKSLGLYLTHSCMTT